MGRKVLKVKNHKKNGSDAAVQGTNDSSIVSKCSTVDAGYFKDEFVNHFVNKRSRRSPLINRGYYVRAAAMDHVFQAFLKTFMCDNKQASSFLGAGFDSSYFRLKSQGLLENTTYFEVDFPDVMRRKKALIQNSPVLKELMSDVTENSEEIILNCTDYKLLGVDLTQLDQLDHCLANKANKSMPTLVLSEVVLAYLDPEASSTIIEWMAANFESALFVSYEQVSPQDSFGIVMTNHFCKLRSPLRSIDTFPEGAAQVARYKKLGWSGVIAADMNYFYTSVLTSRERQRVETLEPFDEFEEWHLHCSHYILLTAFKGACLALRDTVWPDVIPDGETTWQFINQDMTTGVDAFSPMGDDGDGRLCVGDKRYYGTVKLQCQTQCNGCDETDLTLGRQGDSETTYATKAALSHRCDGDRNVASSITTNSDTSKRALEWKCLPPVEGGQRFGHDSAMIGSQYAVTLGGFGADSGRHGRMRTLLVHCALNGTAVDVNVAGDVGSDIENPFERMHHTLTPVGSASLLLFGGRLSPTRPCLQPFLLDFRLSKNQDLDHATGTQSVSSTCDDVILGSGNDAESTRVLGTDSGRCLSLEHRTMPNNCQNTVRMECFCQRLSTAGACPPPRWRHSAVNITIDESPHVIVFGGVSDNQTVFSDTYTFDVQRRSWSKLECIGKIPSPRHSHTANRWNGCMVVSCGLASDLRPLNSIFRLDVVSRTWTEVNIQMGGLMPRYSHTATIIGDRLAIVGGVCLTLQPPGVAVVDLVTGVHQEYDLPQQDPANPIMLHGHSGISSIPSLTERQIVVVGGGGNCFSFGTHLNATPILLTLPSET